MKNHVLSYFLSYIEEINQEYSNLSDKELINVSTHDYSESNFIFKCFSPMRNIVDLSSSANKVRIRSLDFEVDIKYLKNTQSSSGGHSNSYSWAALEKTFTWLSDEIKARNKGKRMIVLGWFNTTKNISEFIQLGESPGAKPKFSYKKLNYFPFLNTTDEYSKGVFIQYSDAYNQLDLKIVGYSKSNINCMFLGKEQDKFHMAIYY